MRTLQKIDLPDRSSKPGPPAKLEWLPLSALRVDDRYQRDIEEKGRANIRRIAARFEWRKFSPVIVTSVGAEKQSYAIIDGQHRCTAALSLGYDKVPCAIVEATPAEAAAVFSAVNGDVVRLSILALFRAALAAKVQWACDIKQACDATGVIPLTKPLSARMQKPLMTNAIGRMRRIATNHSVETLQAVLKIVVADPHSHVPGFINSAQVDAAFRELMKQPLADGSPLVAADKIIAERTAAPVRVVAAGDWKPQAGKSPAFSAVDASSKARVQELKARGFTKSMVAAVTRLRHAVVDELWGDAAG